MPTINGARHTKLSFNCGRSLPLDESGGTIVVLSSAESQTVRRA